MIWIIILSSLLVIITTILIIFVSRSYVSSNPIQNNTIITPIPIQNNTIITPIPIQNNTIITPIPTQNNTKITKIFEVQGGAKYTRIKTCLSKDGSTFACSYTTFGSNPYVGIVRVWRQSGNNWIRFGQDINEIGECISISANGSILAIGHEYNSGIIGVGLDSNSGNSANTIGGIMNSANTNSVNTNSANTIGGIMNSANTIGGIMNSANTNSVNTNSANTIGGIMNSANTNSGFSADQYKNGKTCIFKFDNDKWIKHGDDIIGPAFSLSLSDNGARMAIGFCNIENTRVFELNNSRWTQIGSAIVGEKNAYSGYSVSLSANGNRLAIGSPGINNKIGLAVIYNFSNNSWTSISTIRGKPEGLCCGACVSLSSDGKSVAISQPGDLFSDKGTRCSEGSKEQRCTESNSRGITRIFYVNDDGTKQLGQDIIGLFRNFSGQDISLAGNGLSIAIGSPLSNNFTGVTRIFKFSNNNWEKFDIDIIGNKDLSCCGYNVSLSENGSRLAVVSLEMYETNTSNRGNISIYNT
jgi:hypothetical protein